jgi:hypothetical protein
VAGRLTDAERGDRAMPEAKLQQRVLYRCRRDGWLVMHVPRGGAGKNAQGTGVQWRSQGGSGKGFPDLTMVRDGRLVFAELKRELSYPDADQQAWLEALREAGQEVHVWRPSDLREGRIDALLR